MTNAKVHGTLGFLGFGNMGGAIASGLVQNRAIMPSEVVVYDADPERVRAAAASGMASAASPQDLALRADILLLAVKPQQMDEALGSLGGYLRPETLVISIAAGIPINHVRDRLGGASRVVRTMPNTPALVGAGATGVAMGPGCSEADRETVRAIFEAVGECVFIDEPLMDAVTAVSGCGPAYFFYMVECLTAAGVAAGLSEDAAGRLAVQTLYGAGRLLTSSREKPAELRARVTSKGGATEAALRTLRDDGFEGVVSRGVAAAAARSRELGR